MIVMPSVLRTSKCYKKLFYKKVKRLSLKQVLSRKTSRESCNKKRGSKKRTTKSKRIRRKRSNLTKRPRIYSFRNRSKLTNSKHSQVKTRTSLA